MSAPATGTRRRSQRRHALTLLAVTLALWLPAEGPWRRGHAQPAIPGQTATLLSDGRWLFVGGDGPSGPLASAVVVDATTGASVALPPLGQARAWHTATVAPRGTVLVFGGLDPVGEPTSTTEEIDPVVRTVTPTGPLGLTPRARHSATLLTDGRLLLAGGQGAGGAPVGFAELWDTATGTVTVVPMPLAMDRFGHAATLLPDGSVLISGGVTTTGQPVLTAEHLDPISLAVSTNLSPPTPGGVSDPPRVEATLPVRDAADVPVDTIVALRLSTLVGPASALAGRIALAGPSGLVDTAIVVAEGGRLAFLTPRAALEPGTAYLLTVSGIQDARGRPVASARARFTTAGPTTRSGASGTITRGPTSTGGPADVEAAKAIPMVDEHVWQGARRDGRPHSSWQDLPSLQAPAGVTALAGQVLQLNGEPLAQVTLEVGEGADRVRTRTDGTGRFLLAPAPAGYQELLIDGTSVDATRAGHRYGIFEVGVDLKAGEPTVLPYTIWMPRLDTANVVRIDSPTPKALTITTPRLPGLELHLPEGTVIRDHRGHVVREVSITPIPLDRPPFPLPAGVEVPIYFTIQPGAAYLYARGHQGAQLVYPNGVNALPGTRFAFWNYHASGRGWHVYGFGTTLDDRPQIVPDPKVEIYGFSGAMVGGSDQGGPPGPPPAEQPTDKKDDGDPVDLSTGLFGYAKTDLTLPDLIPIALRRTYRATDTVSRAFGLGTSHPYDMFLVGTTFPYTYMELILPDGGRVHYDRISPGTSFEDAVFEHTGTPTRYEKTRIAWNGAHFFLTLKDGTVYTFRDAFGSTRPMQGGLVAIKDRLGNTVTLTRNADGDLTQIMTPHGRWVDFTYDSTHRITQARDVLGRTLSYAYDGSGRLATVTDAAGGVWQYTYDTLNRIQTLRDARGIVFLTNTYDTTGKVTTQTQADGTTYQFAYTLGAGGKVTQTDVTDPRGTVRRVTFNAAGYPLSDTRALGTPIALTETYERQATTNRLTARTDALGRRTEYTYDTKGNVLTTTRLAGTASAVTTTFTWEPTFQQVATITNPLNQTTTFGYDAQGQRTSVTDPLNHATTLTYNGRGQPLTLTDPLGHVTTLTYDMTGGLAVIIDPLGRATARAYDAGGRLTRQTAAGGSIAVGYDALNRTTTLTDAQSAVTAFTYDPNGNLLTVTDARGSITSYTYDTMDRPVTRTDPLGRSESFGYDPASNLSQHTDRKGQGTTFSYDAHHRRTGSTFTDAIVSYTRDGGGRLLQITDSVGGTISNDYDALDRLTSQATALGTVTYTYDILGRRTQMTVPGQSPVAYVYDPASRLTSITQGTAVAHFTYDAANRRTSLTLPNGVSTQYNYDAASQLTTLDYKLGANPLGSLLYTYDAAGHRIQVDGSWARTGLPGALSSATYNANHQQTTFGVSSLTYDLNGSLTADGVNAYTWDARNRLVSITGPVSATFAYDAMGRRSRKTINGVATDLMYDRLSPVQERSGQTTTNLLMGLSLDEYLGRSDGASTVFFFQDALGSALALADAQGNVGTTYTYEPFGTATTAGASSPNPSQFTGRENDGTGLYYYRARYYHPGFQRFLSEDPLHMAAGDTNLFAYVRSNPVAFRDPLGLRLCRMDLPGLPGALVDDSIALSLAAFVGKNMAQGITVSFNNTFRPTDEQAGLPLNPNAITPAPPGTSLHEGGFAFDLRWRAIPPSQQAAVVANAAAVGFAWGGDFVNPDRPHFYREPLGGRAGAIDTAQADAKCGNIPDCSAALSP